ncbi:beta-lactamase transpeptidase [Chlorella sorokiniana]|uniref:Beta-lactamase transpeptidase n=1 Tax=Chlorella sorokiniana TaxID=3076 RepID=A0A2P6TJZ4_CHLSO|nr:beta-lactamase transpeptidase [Chlorella sorokiniana]|eukprot:PRW44385.1 beta-lactamase transpeptidase [Chlorella sorokiniana]
MAGGELGAASRMRAAPAAQPEVAQLLDALLAEAQASVRPPTEDELEDAAVEEEYSDEEPADGLAHGMKVRQAAEALLIVAERLNSPEVRQRAGQHWAALAGHLDALLTQALYTSTYSDDYDGGDHSILWSRVQSRPSTEVVTVPSSFGSAGRMGQMGGLELLASFFGGMNDQVAAALAHVHSNMTSQASTKRPPLASKLARFDASYQPPADGAQPGGAAVADARCEVSCADAPAYGGLAVGGDCVAVNGACGYKGEECYLAIGRISGDGPWHSRLQKVPCGFHNPADATAPNQENEEPHAKRQNKWGCKILNLLGSTSNEAAAEDAEATAGDEPHGTIQLLAPELGSGQHRDEIEQLLPLGALQGDAPPQQVVVRVKNSNSLFVFDWQDPAPRLHTLLAGHVGNVTAMSSCAALPNMLASGSYDGPARVWDLRTAACTHLLTSKSSGVVPAVALVEDQGTPFCFWSNYGSESILCFDLRMRRCLYELATGNTDVHHLQWHAPSRSLFADTSSKYDSSDLGSMSGVSWPKAMHRPTDFPCAWHVKYDSVICYQFKDAPDLSLLPLGAQLVNLAEAGSDSEDEERSEGGSGSEWETMGSEDEERSGAKMMTSCSNTKFFTAVALWQLAQAGLVDMDAPVSQYMDPADFNQTEPWCPRVKGSPPGSPCANVTARQLLNMGSGLVDTDNCRYEQGAWQRQYCFTDDQTALLINGSSSVGEIGGRGPADYFAAQGYWDMPLEWEPGEGYEYVNANFQLAAYLVEKISGLSYGQYLRERILQPAGLNATHLDMVTGHSGIISDYFPLGSFGYRQVVSPVSPEYIANVSRATSRDPEPLTRVPVGQVADLARVHPIDGFLAYAGGAGAMYATPQDMIEWWHTVLFRPERTALKVTTFHILLHRTQVLNLTQDTVRDMLTSTNAHEALPGVPPSEVAFAQGVVVKPNASYSLYGVSALFYSGGINEVESPFFLAFLDPDGQGPEDTGTVGAVYFAHPQLQVPLNATSCEVESPWEDGSAAVLDEELCAILAGGIREYTTSNLMDIWGLGSPLQPPA